MAISEAQAKAVRKYDKKAYDKFIVSVKKGEKDNIKACADAQSKSLNKFVVDAIYEKINRDKGE